MCSIFALFSYRFMLLRYPIPRDVCSLYQKYAQHPEAKHIIGMMDARILYNQIRRYRPAHCVDLGCGFGTSMAITAAAMDANGHGKITSLEQLEWMAVSAEELLPDVYKRRVRIVRCDTEVRHYFGEEWICYQYTPASADIDFVIVDGPAPWTDEAGNRVQKPNGDLVGFLPYLRPGCRVFVDGRLPTVEAYLRHLGRHFWIQRNRRFKHTVMELIEPL